MSQSIKYVDAVERSLQALSNASTSKQPAERDYYLRRAQVFATLAVARRP